MKTTAVGSLESVGWDSGLCFGGFSSAVLHLSGSFELKVRGLIINGAAESLAKGLHCEGSAGRERLTCRSEGFVRKAGIGNCLSQLKAQSIQFLTLG